MLLRAATSVSQMFGQVSSTIGSVKAVLRT